MRLRVRGRVQHGRGLRRRHDEAHRAVRKRRTARTTGSPHRRGRRAVRLFLFPPFQASDFRIEISLPDLLLEGHDDVDGHVEDAELRLRFVGLEVGHADASELLQSLVDVADSNPFSRVVRRSPLSFSDGFDFRRQVVFVVGRLAALARSLPALGRGRTPSPHAAAGLEVLVGLSLLGQAWSSARTQVRRLLQLVGS